MMKRIILSLIISIFFIGCKSSKIVTSKEEAVERGIYEYDNSTTVSSKRTTRKNTKTTYTEDKEHSTKSTKVTVDSSSINQKIIDDALEFLGVRYRTGGTNKRGVDCSGLVFTAYGNNDVKLPRTSIDMSRHGKKISKRNAEPGDLIFFKTNGRSQINHVGIITEINSDEIKFIHASTSRGVIVSSTAENYYNKAFAQINRVIN